MMISMKFYHINQQAHMKVNAFEPVSVKQLALWVPPCTISQYTLLIDSILSNSWKTTSWTLNLHYQLQKRFLLMMLESFMQFVKLSPNVQRLPILTDVSHQVKLLRALCSLTAICIKLLKNKNVIAHHWIHHICNFLKFESGSIINLKLRIRLNEK